MSVETTTNNFSPQSGFAAERKVTMTSTETEVREFAREFPTPNVQRAVALCEAGTLQWQQVAELFRSSLAKGLEAVR